MKPIDKEIGRMFNVINGFRENSKIGLKHIRTYPEDKEEIIRKYEEFIKLCQKHQQ